MRGLVQRVRRSDPDVASALAVISAFDTLIASQADIVTLASTAAGLADCTVEVSDLWNARMVRVDANGPDGEPARLGQVEEDLPAYGAVEVDGALFAAVQTAAGAIGLVRLSAVDRVWRDVDFMVAERLAASVAIDAMKVHQDGLAASRIDPGALVQLVATGLDDAHVQVALTRTQLPGDRPLVAFAVQSGTEAVGPQVAGQLLADLLRAGEVVARTAVVDSFGLVVAVDGVDLRRLLHRLSETAVSAGSLVVGVGTAGPARHLPTSWSQAVQALAFVPVPARGTGVAAYADLGALALLGRLSTEDVAALDDIRALRELEEADPLDVRLLEMYCESTSMRTVAQRAHMHHSSVDYRLKRIGRTLGIDLSSGAGRLRVLLAVKLLRIGQARERT